MLLTGPSRRNEHARIGLAAPLFAGTTGICVVNTGRGPFKRDLKESAHRRHANVSVERASSAFASTGWRSCSL
ncbi:hypothetical protein F2P81_012581 [Scophthalmus maximus]|uniref:Uncharacterized protein n=1 Tax=Scophthalmus maximus TaxID=52904 RepID=A0A6A4SL45_SCOMX|nr:hypothetical protein F2P81_012581 [Scophthalmus maximus]